MGMYTHALASVYTHTYMYTCTHIHTYLHERAHILSVVLLPGHNHAGTNEVDGT